MRAKETRMAILDEHGRAFNPPPQDQCDHGVTFDIEAARKLLDEAVSKPSHPDPAVAFVLGSSASAEVKRRWPRGWFTAEKPCPKGCGFIGIAYASYEHYIMGDW
jgi:hypothetical protein